MRYEIIKGPFFSNCFLEAAKADNLKMGDKHENLD